MKLGWLLFLTCCLGCLSLKAADDCSQVERLLNQAALDYNFMRCMDEVIENVCMSNPKRPIGNDERMDWDLMCSARVGESCKSFIRQYEHEVQEALTLCR